MADKLYYTIGEVAKMFNVNTSLIRFWEKEFDTINPKKTKKGNRLFTKSDIDNLYTIYILVKERGYTLQGAKEKMKSDRHSIERDTEVIRTLQKVREFLLDIRGEL